MTGSSEAAHGFLRFPNPAQRHQNPRLLVENSGVRLAGRLQGCQFFPCGFCHAEGKPAFGGLDGTLHGVCAVG